MPNNDSITNETVPEIENSSQDNPIATMQEEERNELAMAQNSEVVSIDMSFSSEKIAYLQAIQTEVDRMGTTSLAIKGLGVTIFVAVFTFSSFEKDIACLMSLCSLLIFLIMDVYYFQIERKFRTLYDKIKNNEHAIDFSLAIAKPLSWKSKDSIVSCLRSKSVWLFYGLLIIFDAFIFGWDKIIIKGNCVCFG